jgi:NADH dehydrogenase [ubiquinone] 1 alpha subcomplex assembly factor 7
MTALEQEIRALIESEGPIPVSRYMSLCLGHPQHGYYVTRDPLGAAGDFITAPEVSQMFGELIGIWCAEVWRAMGAPNPVRLVELGPGRGTLMSDLLNAAKVVPEFRTALSPHLVETSPALAEVQRATLARVDDEIQWHRSVETVTEGALIAVANEFVDALPVNQLVKTESGWHERKVGVENGRLVFAADPAPLPGFDSGSRQDRAEAGAVFEWRDLAPVRELSRRIVSHGGAALMIDYGHTRSGFGDTLQAVRAHRVSDPLENPGQADLTAHVDFEQLAEAGAQLGAHVFGPVTQGQFLRALGIELRADNLKHGRDAGAAQSVDEAVLRLTAPSPGMGELFKVLALAHPDLQAPPGFDT